MIVRCERCDTEYELDDARLAAGVATVKCTSCGLVFRTDGKTDQRKAVSAHPEIPDATDPGIMSEIFEEDGQPTVEAQLWMLRSPDGQVARVPDLTTLQRLIGEGKVGREHAISRTGELWRKLGEVAELASFFLPAAGRRQPTLIGRGVPAPGSGDTDAGSESPTTERPRGLGPIPQTRPQLVFAPGVLASAPGSGPPATPGSQRPPVPAATPPQRPPAPPTPPPRPAAPPPAPPPSAPRGGTGPHAAPLGMAPDDGQEPAWAGGAGASKAPRLQGGGLSASGPMRAAGGQLRTQDEDPFDDMPRRRSKAPWLLLVLGVAGAAAGAYVLTRKEGASTPALDGAAALATVDAAALAALPPDAAPILVTPTGTAASALAKATGLIADDTDASLTQAETLLEGARGPDPAANARVLATLARLHAIVAQHLLDDAAAEGTDKRTAEQRRAESARRRLRAETAAREALASSPNAPDASIALADARRLAGAKASEVEKLLKVAGEDPEAAYVRGMLLVRDKKEDAAVKALTTAARAAKAAGGEHVRARERLARVALGRGKLDEAQAELDLALAESPKHPRLEAIGLAIAARRGGGGATPDAAPVAASGTGTTPTGTGGAGSSSSPEPTTYEGFVARGDRLAEANKCAQALDYYEKAYDLRPGAEALTGQGYCYLDMSSTAAALAKFRAALAMDSRSGDAIIGMAEVNRAKGDKAEAARYYARYLELMPGGPKSALARKWLDDLGGAPPVTPPGGTGTPVTPDPPRPDAASAPITPPPPDRLPDRPATETPPPEGTPP